MTAALSLFQESEPISHYLHVEIGTELRQRLARMGMDMLLKMVGTWLGLQEKDVFLQKLFSLDNKAMWLKREPICFLPVSGLGKAWAGHAPDTESCHCRGDICLNTVGLACAPQSAFA